MLRLYLGLCKISTLSGWVVPQFWLMLQLAGGCSAEDYLASRSRGVSLPAQVHFSDGFKQFFDSLEVLPHHGEGAIQPFTRDFFTGSSDAALLFFEGE